MRYIISRFLLKGRKAYPVGTERMHGGVKVKKTQDGWKPVSDPKQQSLFGFDDSGGFTYTKKTPLKDDKKISEQINKATPETRNEVKTNIFGFDPKTALKPEKYEFKPESINFNGINILDYSTVDHSKIYTPKIDTMEKEGLPSYVPDISDEVLASFSYYRHEFIATKEGDGNYIVYDFKGKPFAKVSIDILTVMSNYYRKLTQIAEMKSRTPDSKEDIEAAWQFILKMKDKLEKIKIEGEKKYGEIESYEVFIKKLTRRHKKSKLPPTPKKLIMFTGSGMSRIQGDVFKKQGLPRNLWFMARNLMREEMGQKNTDMTMQLSDLESTYVKGQITSFGPEGTKDTLLDSHGVLVKRQDGSEIKEEDTEMIKDSLDSLYKIFGSLKSMSRKYNLKISHSGKRLMHAQKSTGIFFPAYHTIGVSAKHGKSQFGFTMAHEFAHFIDNQVGTSQKRHFASDDFHGKEFEIADGLRKNSNTIAKSEYYRRTTECFARALEQYFAEQSSTPEEFKKNYSGGIYANLPYYEKTLRPIIKKYLKDKKDILKSFMEMFRFED